MTLSDYITMKHSPLKIFMHVVGHRLSSSLNTDHINYNYVSTAWAQFSLVS